MGNLIKRGGSVQIRVGGNTQDTATLVPSLADGQAIEKDKLNSNNPVRARNFGLPTIAFSLEHRRRPRLYFIRQKLYICSGTFHTTLISNGSWVRSHVDPRFADVLLIK